MTQPLGPVMLDIEGTQLSDDERHLLARPEVGGVILFKRNTHDAKQVRSLTRAIREIRPDVLLAIDQEGGRVQRLRDGVTRLPAMATLAAGYGETPEAVRVLAHEAGWLLGMEMAACGFDITFAPVLDVDDQRSPAIGDRSFSADPDVVATLGGAFIDGLHEAGMIAVGKHFPGHGGVNLDSHHALPEDTRSLATLRAHDLIPFKTLAGKLDAVMPAHVVYTAFDARPAGFSPSWLGMLREELMFKGVVFSDDLSMAGAHVAGPPSTRAQAAWTAGCDMVLVCNDRAAALEVLDAAVGHASKRLGKLRYGRARPELETLPALARWRRAHARLESLSETLAD
ncbi:beta-N-acetylhexosaminidase [Chromohalobacter marismortui]|uniref:Beta-hexosaminidase n=1 Tax=Chromohalobacter marismortui TaxID=42055 RepID=A0A4V3F578_9GAMM|nr:MULTISPECIES: beta-N-acetylhexosaminidase [Chromohalobacter]MCI0508749.1 beta-N-acetylhexosaminidase [Chromohalobacter sp.]MCI0594606.1 beta-N-acetylhexosaminidase [Chromohalobacter sp.]TDU22886.1 beta-N-acetylhexosaminidase [Chromohalobacter marismortui]